ncbi:uncharacterized protein DC041_0005478 [Schistosoma bovis]|uniref:Uncharacterized protein n=1 Tax=Schistosoma bovis TaxID=6184 RepID=A0A430QUG9_SCHBO|nr:uncharacterized protein DC041_0005478 [Schistosoma bovis]
MLIVLLVDQLTQQYVYGIFVQMRNGLFKHFVDIQMLFVVYSYYPYLITNQIIIITIQLLHILIVGNHPKYY